MVINDGVSKTTIEYKAYYIDDKEQVHVELVNILLKAYKGLSKS